MFRVIQVSVLGVASSNSTRTMKTKIRWAAATLMIEPEEGHSEAVDEE
jgi:hypothetical protein